jgi:Ca-activated chloride channel homolog
MSLHFIRPEWLLAALPLALVLYLLRRQTGPHSAWDRYIAPHLASLLIVGGTKAQPQRLGYLLSAWAIAVLALAGPAVNKQKLPVFATAQGRVLVMDMSLSMYATDLAPNRLSQAKFHATDLINKLSQGDSALIAFAGDAFTLSPLTRDSATLLNLLPTLSPDIMPVLGSNPAAALRLARSLLAQGGHLRGDIILLTDGINPRHYDAATEALEGSQYRLSVMAFGTPQGAPIRLPDGQLLRDNGNEVVIAKTDLNLLQRLANQHGGILTLSQADGSDVTRIHDWLAAEGDTKETELDGESWQDLGPYLALLLLLPMLLCFRHGMVAGLALCLLLPQSEVLAQETSMWDSLWHTSDQRGAMAFENKDYRGAAEQFDDPQWRASAHYKAGDFEQALKGFEQDMSTTGLFNQGNSLMQMGKPADAMKRYEDALKQDPDFAEARDNLALAKRLEQVQKQQQQQGSDKNQDAQDKQSGESDQAPSEQSQGDQENSDAQSQSQAQSQAQQGQEGQEADTADNTAGEQESQQDAAQQDEHRDAGDAQSPSGKQMMQADASTDARQGADESQQDQDQGQKASAARANAAGQADENSDEQDQVQTQVAASELNPDALPPEMERALRALADDPQVLLRNKIQLEYQKRRQRGQLPKDNEQW